MTDLTGEKALVTGATGFIGSHVVRRLLREGVEVRAFVRSEAKAGSLRAEGAEIWPGDITNEGSVKDAIRGCQFLFHFAGLLGNEHRPREYFRSVNVEGARSVMEAALSEKVKRIIYASSAWVYGMDAGKDTDESASLRVSGDPYCDTKVEAELLIRESIKSDKLPCIIVQPTTVYGPGDETWTLGPIKLMRSGMMIYPGGGKGLVQPVYIDDLVDGIMAAFYKGRLGEQYLLCGGAVMQIKEFFGHFARMVGRRWIPAVPGRLALESATLLEKKAELTGGQPLFTRCAVRGALMSASYRCDKARREFGFAPRVTIEEGMKRVERWLATSSPGER